MAEARDVELRGSVTKSFMQRLDAIAQVDGVGRVEWLVRLAEPEIDRRAHAASLLLRMLDGNPTGTDRGAE
jgi:hypothetical protein